MCCSKSKKPSRDQLLAVCKLPSGRLSYKCSDTETLNICVSIIWVVANGLLDTGTKCNYLFTAFAKHANVSSQISADEVGLRVKVSSVKTQGSYSGRPIRLIRSKLWRHRVLDRGYSLVGRDSWPRIYETTQT